MGVGPGAATAQATDKDRVIGRSGHLNPVAKTSDHPMTRSPDSKSVNDHPRISDHCVPITGHISRSSVFDQLRRRRA